MTRRRPHINDYQIGRPNPNGAHHATSEMCPLCGLTNGKHLTLNGPEGLVRYCTQAVLQNKNLRYLASYHKEDPFWDQNYV